MRAPKKFKSAIPLNALGSVLSIFLFFTIAIICGLCVGVLVFVFEIFSDQSTLELALQNSPETLNENYIGDFLSKYAGLFTWMNLPLFFLTIYFGLKIFKGITLEEIISYSSSKKSVMFFSTLGAIGLVLAMSPYFPEPQQKELDLVSMVASSWIGLLAIVVMAPITEEIFFRIFLIKGLVKYHSPWIAILVSSILFGIIHMNLWQALPAFFLGLYFGYIFIITNNTLLVIIMHGTVNFIGVLPFLFASDLSTINPNPQYADNAGITGLILFFCSIYFVLKDEEVMQRLLSVDEKNNL